MSDTNMPVTEATSGEEQELQSYEFAFHVLPTVAEGEVIGVFDAIKAQITKDGGEIIGEEAPERFDLAYEIEKYLEGKNRKFSSAYFGWVRFRLSPAKLTTLTEELDSMKALLRFLMIKLTKVEEESAFRFHESLVNRKVTTVTDEDISEGEVDDVVDTAVEDDNTESVEAEVIEVAEDDGEEVK